MVFHLWDKILDINNLKAEGLLWFTVSEVISCELLTSYAWTEHHGGRHGSSSQCGGKTEEREEGARDKMSLGPSPVLNFL